MRQRKNLPKHCAFDKSSTGFTLIEMLVTLFIVIALAVSLFTVSKQAIASAQNSNCLANLRAWATPIALYTADNGGTFPLSAPFNNGAVWYSASSPLVLNYVWANNSGAGVQMKWTQGRGINGCKAHKTPFYSYLYNYHIGEPNLSSGKYYIGRTGLISQPSKVAMIVEGDERTPATSGFSLLYQQEQRFGLIHGGKGNVLFVDGHVEARTTLQRSEIYPDAAAKGL